MVSRLVALPLWALTLSACGGDDAAQPVPPPVVTPSPTPTPTPPVAPPSIPRLAAGPHLGMITGFEALDQARLDIEAARYAEAKAAGMSIGRVQIDWAELEPQEGVYDATVLDDALSAATLNDLNIYVTLSTLDTDGLTLPDYLLNNGTLRSGLTLASPEVTGAFTNMLSWLSGQLQARNVWALSLGNEVDVPVSDGLVSRNDAITFFQSGLRHWNTINPDIAVTVTVTVGAPDSQTALSNAIRDASDIMTYNYYCLAADITVIGEEDWRRDVAAMKQAAGDRQIFIQELGCPTGYGATGQASNIGGSTKPAWQSWLDANRAVRSAREN